MDVYIIIIPYYPLSTIVKLHVALCHLGLESWTLSRKYSPTRVEFRAFRFRFLSSPTYMLVPERQHTDTTAPQRQPTAPQSSWGFMGPRIPEDFQILPINCDPPS